MFRSKRSLAEWIAGAVSIFKINVKENLMARTKKIEVFSAGCSLCEGVIEVVKRIAGSSHEVVVHEMRQPEVASKAKQYGVRSIPGIVIDGKLASCCAGRGLDENVLRASLG